MSHETWKQFSLLGALMFAAAPLVAMLNILANGGNGLFLVAWGMLFVGIGMVIASSIVRRQRRTG